MGAQPISGGPPGQGQEKGDKSPCGAQKLTGDSTRFRNRHRLDPSGFQPFRHAHQFRRRCPKVGNLSTAPIQGRSAYPVPFAPKIVFDGREPVFAKAAGLLRLGFFTGEYFPRSRIRPRAGCKAPTTGTRIASLSCLQYASRTSLSAE
jgi:hypothetical protein